MRHQLTIQNPLDYVDIPSLFQIKQWVSTTLQSEPHNYEMTIRLTNTSEITELNTKYRNKNNATNVLSFPCQIPEQVTQNLDIYPLGDIILCHPYIIQEAKELGLDVMNHYAHMMIHGTLHLLGYDHMTEQEMSIMEPLEINLLAKFGIKNPYEEPK